MLHERLICACQSIHDKRLVKGQPVVETEAFLGERAFENFALETQKGLSAFVRANFCFVVHYYITEILYNVIITLICASI